MPRPLRSLAPCLLVLLLLPACLTGSTSSSRFYELRASDPAVGALRADGPSLVVELVAFPGVLDRPQLSDRGDDHRRRVDEYERWIEPLDQAVPQVLAAELRVLLDSQRVEVDSRRLGDAFDTRLRLAVDRFDADGLAAEIQARWLWIVNGAVAGRGAARRVEMLTGSSAVERVAALETVLLQLAQSLAADYRALGVD